MAAFAAARIVVPPPESVTIGEAEGELLVLLRPAILQDGQFKRDDAAESANEATLGRFRGRVEGVEYPSVGVPSTHQTSSVRSPLLRSRTAAPPPRAISAAPRPPIIETLLSIVHPAAYLLGLGDLLASYVPLAPLPSFPADAPVRAVAWHPYKSRLAVAQRNNTIVLYDLGAQSWSPLALHSELQIGITALQWAPRAGNVLAVAGARGVCVWSTVGRPSYSSLETHAFAAFERGNLWLDLLSAPGHAPVSSIAWSPCGRFLASCSAAQHELIVWDWTAGRASPLLRYGGATLVRWSPNGLFLFAAGGGTFFRVWETTSWTSTRWDLSHAPVQTAVWSPDSRYLLLAERGRSTFYAIHMGDRPPPARGAHMRTEELAACELECGTSRAMVGGVIRQLEWDQAGERLAVTFENSELIALYASRLTPTLEFSPKGFIRGPACQPVVIAFKPQFNRGALLATCWDSGKISFTPLYYATTAVLSTDTLAPASFRVMQ